MSFSMRLKYEFRSLNCRIVMNEYVGILIVCHIGHFVKLLWAMEDVYAYTCGLNINEPLKRSMVFEKMMLLLLMFLSSMKNQECFVTISMLHYSTNITKHSKFFILERNINTSTILFFFFSLPKTMLLFRGSLMFRATRIHIYIRCGP